MCVCVFNQTVKAGKKLILGWSCDSNMGEKKTPRPKKAAREACLSQRGPSSRVAVHLLPESLHKDLDTCTIWKINWKPHTSTKDPGRAGDSTPGPLWADEPLPSTTEAETPIM